MKNTLEIDRVQLYLGNRMILNNIYVKFETGCVTGIVGRNGCGKSSLFKLIFSEIKSAERSIRFNGRVVLNDEINDRVLKMLPQFSFIPKGLKVKKVFRDYDLSYDKFCDIFPDFSQYSNYRVGDLSAGNIRIIEIYLVLKSESLFCILDEPFTFLSPQCIDLFIILINEVKQTKGILISDHKYKYIKELSDEIYVLENGVSHRVNKLDEIRKYGYF